MRFVFSYLLMVLVAAPLHAAPVKVLASFSILGDLAKQVGGENVEVIALVGADSDAHAFTPKPSDVKVAEGADVLVFNGLGFEGWMDRLIKSSGTKAKVVVASNGITPHKMQEEAHDHDHGHDHGDEGVDPHAWQSVPNVMRYVQNIRDGLIAVDKPNEETYRNNADRYLAKLRTLDAWVRAQLGAVPAEKRKIITNHDAFGYLGKEYDVKIIAAHGIANEAEPGAKHFANLIKQVKGEGVKVVFIENVSDPRLMQKLEKQTGAKFGGKLYSDALSATPPADSYEGLMRWNITAISEAVIK